MTDLPRESLSVVQVMNQGVYVAALLHLTAHSSEAVVRRALKLLTASISSLTPQDKVNGLQHAPIICTVLAHVVQQIAIVSDNVLHMPTTHFGA